MINANITQPYWDFMIDTALYGKDWYHISDSYVSKTNKSNIFGPTSYILFYKRRKLSTNDKNTKKKSKKKKTSDNNNNNNNPNNS